MIKTYLAYFFLGHGIHEQQIRKIHVNTFSPNENNAEVFSWGGGTFFHSLGSCSPRNADFISAVTFHFHELLTTCGRGPDCGRVRLNHTQPPATGAVQ